MTPHKRRAYASVAIRSVLIAGSLLACGEHTPRTRKSASAAAPATSTSTSTSTSDNPERIATGSAPPAEDGLTAIDGAGLLERIEHSGHKGALVNVWASWCGSCKQELPMLIDMADALRREGIDLFLISADEPKARKDAAAVIAGTKAEQPVFIVRGQIGSFIHALNPAWRGAVPSTFLYDAQAKLRYFWPGPVYEYEVTPIVEAFLMGRPLEGPARVEHGPRPE
jgi:thiol-disulfide isomerase/thioredoxin